MPPNTSILQCPKCQKPLVNIASKVERIHPVAVFIDKYYMRIMLVGIICSLAIFLAVVLLSQPPEKEHISIIASKGRAAGFALLAAAITPAIIMYFLVRCFSLYRITDCPYCGFHEKQKLGRSNTS